MRFGYPNVGPRFDPDQPDRPTHGLRSGRFWLRLVAGVVLAVMAVLTIAGNGDTASAMGWLLLVPLGVVLFFVEAAALFSDTVWDGDD
ncbi:MAG: hypothetical protein AAFZ07_04830 [Actinomycetota bacterium]